MFFTHSEQCKPLLSLLWFLVHSCNLFHAFEKMINGAFNRSHFKFPSGKKAYKQLLNFTLSKNLPLEIRYFQSVFPILKQNLTILEELNIILNCIIFSFVLLSTNFSCFTIIWKLFLFLLACKTQILFILYHLFSTNH